MCLRVSLYCSGCGHTRRWTEYCTDQESSGQPCSEGLCRIVEKDCCCSVEECRARMQELGTEALTEALTEAMQRWEPSSPVLSSPAVDTSPPRVVSDSLNARAQAYMYELLHRNCPSILASQEPFEPGQDGFPSDIRTSAVENSSH